MKDNKATNGNVIQFPGSKKETAVKPQTSTTPPPVPQGKKISKKMLGTAFAIVLASFAANRYTFEKQSQSMDLASNSNSSRAIASVDRPSWHRDADWEMDLSERLASQARNPASTGVGRAATVEEKLRWGILEEKYTILFKTDAHEIDTISFQDASANPSYILNRKQFLNDYGTLLSSDFNSAQLKSVEVSGDKTVESYTLYDKDKRPKSRARFELDVHQRLLSLKVEPSQI